jgi:hypothetical protein
VNGRKRSPKPRRRRFSREAAVTGATRSAFLLVRCDSARRWLRHDRFVGNPAADGVGAGVLAAAKSSPRTAYS